MIPFRIHLAAMANLTADRRSRRRQNCAVKHNKSTFFLFVVAVNRENTKLFSIQRQKKRKTKVNFAGVCGVLLSRLNAPQQVSPPGGSKTAMNPVSLYITTSRLVFQSGCGGLGEAASTTGTDSLGNGNANSNSSAFADLNRLLPYLRKSLSCAVCCRLLLEPHTPAELNCQHHVCRGCVGERKKLKPSCGSCKDYNRYVENTQLRMLLQCYKSICEYIKTKPLFAEIRLQATGSSAINGMSLAAVGQSAVGGINTNSLQPNNNSVPSNLWELIEEGARFQDTYRCSSGLTKSAYSILPCIYPTPPVAVSVPTVSVSSSYKASRWTED